MVLPIIVLILSSITLIPTIVVLFYSAINWKKTHHFFLASFFLSVIFYLLPFILSTAKLLRYVPYLLKSGIIFYLLIPGILTLYVNSFIEKSFHFKKKYLLFLIVPFLAFLDYLFFHIQNYEQLDEIVNLIEKNSANLFRIEGFIPFKLNLILRYIYILPVGFIILKKTFYIKKQGLITTEDKSTFTFLKYLLFALFYNYINFFATLILPFIDDKIDFTNPLNSSMIIISGSMIFYFSISLLISPHLLFDLKETRKKDIQLNNETSEEDVVLLNAINTKMSEEKFYLNENFSSQDVLTKFKISRSKLDDLLVQSKGISFAEWLNSFRIEYAKKLLLSNEQYTIDALSSMSGFSSRSAFYAAFKKITQITPTEFIKKSKKEIL